jgi:transposase
MIQVQLKLRPTKAQERTMERWLWHLTGVYNWAVKTIEHQVQGGHRLSLFDLRARTSKSHLEIPPRRARHAGL